MLSIKSFLLAISVFLAFTLSAAEVVVLKPLKEIAPGTDDSVRIKAAIQQVSLAGGGVVYLRKGVYHVANPVNIWSNVTLRGQGKGTVIRLVDNADSFNGRAGIIRVVDDTNKVRVSNVLVEDLFIDGNRDNQTQGIGEIEKKFGIYAEGDHLTFRRVTTANCMGYGFDPHGDKKADGSFEASTNVTIENSRSYGNMLDGFTLDRLEESTFRNNLAYKNDRHGINIVSDTIGMEVYNNETRNNGANGIMVQNGSRNLVIRQNRVNNNAEAGIILRASDNNQLYGNVIMHNNFEAIRVRGSSNNVIYDNSTLNNSRIEARKYHEIRFEDYIGIPSLNNVVRNNVFLSKRSQGVVYEKDNANINLVEDNRYETRSKTPFKLNGTQSQAVNNSEVQY